MATANTTLAALSVEILDGPPVSGAMRDNPLRLFIGDTPEEGDVSVESTQEWRGLGKQGREQRGEIICTAQAFDATGNMSVARTTAFEIFGAVENMLRAEATVAGTVRVAEVGTRESYIQRRIPDGAI